MEKNKSRTKGPERKGGGETSERRGNGLRSESKKNEGGVEAQEGKENINGVLSEEKKGMQKGQSKGILGGGQVKKIGNKKKTIRQEFQNESN